MLYHNSDMKSTNYVLPSGGEFRRALQRGFQFMWSVLRNLCTAHRNLRRLVIRA